MLTIVDIGIIVLVLISAAAGFKKGFFSELVSLLGFVAIIVIAFKFKTDLATVFYSNLPFFKFSGDFAGVTVLNILVYEVTAFILIFIVLGVALKVVLIATNILEAILKFTIIFGFPSKVMGAIVGAMEGYIIAFLILLFMNQPTIAGEMVAESKYAKVVLNNTPYISEQASNIIDSANEVYELKEKFKDYEDKEEFNKEALIVLLDNKIVSVESVELLVEKNKLEIEGIEEIIEEYK